MERPIFKTHSIIQDILYFLLKCAYGLCAIYSIYHFRENPVVSIIATVIFLLFLLIAGKEAIEVFPTYFTIKRGGLLYLFEKEKVLEFDKIKSIYFKGDYDTADEIYNPSFKSDRKANIIYIEFKNGQNIRIPTTLYVGILTECIAFIKQRANLQG